MMHMSCMSKHKVTIKKKCRHYYHLEVEYYNFQENDKLNG